MNTSQQAKLEELSDIVIKIIDTRLQGGWVDPKLKERRDELMEELKKD